MAKMKWQDWLIIGGLIYFGIKAFRPRPEKPPKEKAKPQVGQLQVEVVPLGESQSPQLGLYWGDRAKLRVRWTIKLPPGVMLEKGFSTQWRLDLKPTGRIFTWVEGKWQPGLAMSPEEAAKGVVKEETIYSDPVLQWDVGTTLDAKLMVRIRVDEELSKAREIWREEKVWKIKVRVVKPTVELLQLVGTTPG